MTPQEIKDNAPKEATHHMTFSYGAWYLRKHNKQWQRWIFNNQWQNCKPSLFLRLFKIKPLT